MIGIFLDMLITIILISTSIRIIILYNISELLKVVLLDDIAQRNVYLQIYPTGYETDTCLLFVIAI